MRNTENPVKKTRIFFGSNFELTTWKMKDGSDTFGAAYYHGADPMVIQYGDTEEEAIQACDKALDDWITRHALQEKIKNDKK